MGSTRHYTIDSQQVVLPKAHRLPQFQAAHPLYDRFLPFLCRDIPADEWAIDVGANVGDTAVAMLQAGRCRLLCVEAEPTFFSYLEQNTADFRSRAVCLNAMVGTGAFSGALDVTEMSSRLNANGSGLQARTLDAIAASCGAEPVALLKVDTDGYDSDVILSAPNMIHKSRPVLFWENYATAPDEVERLDGFYKQLSGLGYERAWIFDNYGNPMVCDCPVEHVSDINRYVAAQNFHGCTRTMDYTDVVAAPAERRGMVQAAVDAFRREYVEISRQPRSGLRHVGRRILARLR